VFWAKPEYIGRFSRNFFTIALPCIYIGMYIRRFEHKLSFSSRQWSAILIILLLLLCFENKFIFQSFHHGNVILLTIPCTIITFIWALKTISLNCFSCLARIGGKDSLNIYILHVLVYEYLRKTIFDVEAIEWIEVCLLTLLLSIVVNKGSKWLKTMLRR
jgi:hypothetical protein